MEKIRVEDSVGTVLAHDITRISKGKFKGPAFKKGHTVKSEDIPELIEIGKRHLYILELGKDQLHENDAAYRISRAISGPFLLFTEPQEGKISIKSEMAGLLKVNVNALFQVNKMENIIVATLKNNFPCKKEEIVAGTRIIPLTIPKKNIDRLETFAAKKGPIIRIIPYKHLKIGAVVTGSEIYEGLVKDDFDATIGKKIARNGCELIKKITVPDDKKAISQAIKELENIGADIIITTGGLSVDPDDVTRQGVLQSGANINFYGTPVLPGSMLMVSTLGGVSVISLPACVFYHDKTVFDLIFPRVLAGEPIRRDDIINMGHGGLCMNCKECHYPACSFGR